MYTGENTFPIDNTSLEEEVSKNRESKTESSDWMARGGLRFARRQTLARLKVGAWNVAGNRKVRAEGFHVVIQRGQVI